MSAIAATTAPGRKDGEYENKDYSELIFANDTSRITLKPNIWDFEYKYEDEDGAIVNYHDIRELDKTVYHITEELGYEAIGGTLIVKK